MAKAKRNNRATCNDDSTISDGWITVSNHAYVAIQESALEEFGDEGHDIGDAGDIVNLVSNTCPDPIGASWPDNAPNPQGVFEEPHNSYTTAQMRWHIAWSIHRISIDDHATYKGKPCVAKKDRHFPRVYSFAEALRFVNMLATADEAQSARHWERITQELGVDNNPATQFPANPRD